MTVGSAVEGHLETTVLLRADRVRRLYAAAGIATVTSGPDSDTMRGVPVITTQGSLAAYLTYWLENVAVHQLRETTHTRDTAVMHQYLIPGMGRKKLAKLSAKDVRTWHNELRITCQCCARGIDAPEV